MTVLFSPEVRLYLDDLIDVLFEKEYFGFEDSSIKYVKDLIIEIRDSLPNKLKRPAPPYFKRYGKEMYYAVFKKNNTTQWYAFFTIYESNGEEIYLVRYISNNHVDAQNL